jgi:predicted acyltransferase
VKATRHHLTSVDAFRGLTIAAMILVNHPGNWGAVYPQLLHATWNGCTIADLVFPFFVFIMGFVMPFAFARRRDGAGHDRLGARVWRRAVALIALGLILNVTAAAPQVGAMRFPGVLQRIGVVYLVTALIVLNLGRSAWAVTAVLLMLAHWGILVLVPFGGHPAGTLTRAVNLAGYVDTCVFGRHTLTIEGDPEGLLGTLPTVATALLGALAGDWVRAADAERHHNAGLIGGGALAVAIGLAWATVFPLNKPLWTGSYALVASGLAALVVAVLYRAVDVHDIRIPFQPFIWLGVNPLALYFLSELTGHAIERPWFRHLAIKDVIFWRFFEPTFGRGGSPLASLAFGVAFATFWIAVGGLLYRRGIRVQV